MPWLSAHGLNVPLLLQQATSSHISSFAWADALISGITVVVLIIAEGRRIGMRSCGFRCLVSSLALRWHCRFSFSCGSVILQGHDRTGQASLLGFGLDRDEAQAGRGQGDKDCLGVSAVILDRLALAIGSDELSSHQAWRQAQTLRGAAPVMGAAAGFHADHCASRQRAKPAQLNSRRATIRPAQSATQATKTYFARSTPTVVISILTSPLAVRNERQQFNLGIKMAGASPPGGWGNTYCSHTTLGVGMPVCPKCLTKLDSMYVLGCWKCNAGFGDGSDWKPIPKQLDPKVPATKTLKPPLPPTVLGQLLTYLLGGIAVIIVCSIGTFATAFAGSGYNQPFWLIPLLGATQALPLLLFFISSWPLLYSIASRKRFDRISAIWRWSMAIYFSSWAFLFIYAVISSAVISR